MNAHQKEVDDFVQKHKLACSGEARLLDLVSEVGELSKEVLKANGYGAAPFKATPHFAEEVGDAYFSLLALANATQVDLDQCLRMALRKYSERLALKGTAGSDGNS